MNEILALKQELLKGNFNEACDLIEEIEIMARQDRINQIETNLALIISRLIVIQVKTSVDFTIVEQLRNYLIEIEQCNRLGNSFYIQENEWQLHYARALSLGILKAIDIRLLPFGMGVEKLGKKINLNILKIEVLGLIRLANSIDACELDTYLRSRFAVVVS